MTDICRDLECALPMPHMADHDVPRSPQQPRTEAGKRLVETWGGDGGHANIAAILAIEAEAAAIGAKNYAIAANDYSARDEALKAEAAAPRSGEGLDAENCAICGMTPHRCVTAEAAIERHSDIERARQLEDWERRVGRPPEGWGPMPELRAARLRENTNA